eukprot:763539-Hanusia_phi.AAC.1
MVTVGHSVEKVERLWKWRMSENWRQSQMVMAIDTMLASERSCKTVRLQERKDRRWRSQRKVDQGDEAKEGQDIAQTLRPAMLLPCRDTRRLLFSLFISSSPTLPYPTLPFIRAVKGAVRTPVATRSLNFIKSKYQTEGVTDRSSFFLRLIYFGLHEKDTGCLQGKAWGGGTPSRLGVRAVSGASAMVRVGIGIDMIFRDTAGGPGRPGRITERSEMDLRHISPSGIPSHLLASVTVHGSDPIRSAVGQDPSSLIAHQVSSRLFYHHSIPIPIFYPPFLRSEATDPYV